MARHNELSRTSRDRRCSAFRKLSIQRACLALLVLAFGTSMVHRADAGYEHTCKPEDALDSPRGICGTQLSGFLHLICGSKGVDKRSDASSLLAFDSPKPVASALLIKEFDVDTLTADSDSESGGKGRSIRSAGSLSADIFMPRTEAVSYLHSKRRYHTQNGYQGISCECCVHECSISELRQYCKG